MIHHVVHFIPGINRRVPELPRTAGVLVHGTVAISATGLRRSARDLRDRAAWHDVTCVRIGALSAVVEARGIRFWLSKSAPNYLLFVELLRALAPPCAERSWVL